ncbi:MAG: hypothetical protein KA273_01000, partial [Bacteroidales bacterium]|nr:hypothetical protein [Bacteroidales bacterium]
LIKNAEPGKVISKKKIGFDKKEINNKTDEYILGNIFDFLGSDFFTIEKNKMKEKTDTLFYFKHNELEEDRQYFIFTASPQAMLYDHAYGDRVVYLDYSDIENKGEIHQYIDFSFSQTSLKGKNCVDFVKKHIGYDPVITYMKYKKLFPDNSTSLHLWNLEGFNCYNKRNINIVGTPHLPEYIYLLNGAFIGIDVNSVREMEYLKVEHNNYHFNFMTYENKVLQKLQFSFIENQLIQAIGRSRLIHNKCIVRLFSNFPVKGGIIIYEEEENKVNSVSFEENNEEIINNNGDFEPENDENKEKSA